MEAHQDLIQSTLSRCIDSLPHKVFLYAAIVGEFAADGNEDFTKKFVDDAFESLRCALDNGYVAKSKVLLRFFSELAHF